MGVKSRVSCEDKLRAEEKWHGPLKADDGIAQSGMLYGNASPFDYGRDLPSTESALTRTLPTNSLDVAERYHVQERAFGHSGRKRRTNNPNPTRKTPREIWNLSQEKSSAHQES